MEAAEAGSPGSGWSGGEPGRPQWSAPTMSSRTARAAAARSNPRVPEDVAVAECNDLPMSAPTAPADRRRHSGARAGAGREGNASRHRDGAPSSKPDASHPPCAAGSHRTTGRCWGCEYDHSAPAHTHRADPSKGRRSPAHHLISHKTAGRLALLFSWTADRGTGEVAPMISAPAKWRRTGPHPVPRGNRDRGVEQHGCRSPTVCGTPAQVCAPPNHNLGTSAQVCWTPLHSDASEEPAVVTVTISATDPEALAAAINALRRDPALAVQPEPQQSSTPPRL